MAQHMVNFLDAATQAVRRSFCLATGRLGVWSELVLGSENPLGAIPAGIADFGRAIACDLPPPSTTAPPFTGGQCVIDYRVDIAFEYSINANASSPTYTPGTDFKNFVPGPITGIRVVTTGGGTGKQIVADRNGGTTSFFGVSGSAGSVDIRNARITSVTPNSGGTPDNCGNPPAVRPPYTPGDNTVGDTITYVNSNNTTVNVPVVVAFGYAQINANAQITIPFTLNATLNAPVNVSGEINLSTGDINFGGGNPGSTSGGCRESPDNFKPDDTLPEPPSGIGTGDPDPPIDPEKPQLRKQIRGAIVTTTTVPPGITVIPQGDNPDVYAPDVGVVSFLVSVGGERAWTEDIRIKNQRQFVPLAWDGGAVQVRGTPRIGGEFIVTPVYVKVTDQQTYPA